MGRKSTIVAAVIAVMVAIGVALAALQPWLGVPADDSNGGTIIANGTEPAPKEIVSIASERENAVASVEVSYYLDKPTAPSDLVIVGDIRHATSESNYIPVSAQAVAVVYNIPSFPDIPSGMKLNTSLLVAIFNGTITRWDDPTIKSLNGDMNLPSERIIVV
ncbi:MAG: hypothetical protein E6K85_05205, partial [Thaumarchaeota archaeon]